MGKKIFIVAGVKSGPDFSKSSIVFFRKCSNLLENPICMTNCVGQSLFVLGCANVEVHHNIFEDQKGAIYENCNTHLLVESNVFSATCAKGAPTPGPGVF